MRRSLPSYPECPVCGDPAVNSATLAVRWAWDEDARRVVGAFVPSRRHTGYAGRVHGGILSALLDECMAWACVVERGTYCMTGELTVRFKTPAVLGERIELTGGVLDGWGPYLRAEGEARSASGLLLATAVASFAALSREESLRLHSALHFRPGDLDVLA